MGFSAECSVRLPSPTPRGHAKVAFAVWHRAGPKPADEENNPRMTVVNTATIQPETRVSLSCFRENRNPGLKQSLYPTETAQDRAPQGASILCCSVAPRCGGSLSSAG